MVRSKIRRVTGLCGSRELSHLAALFIDRGTEVSIAKSRVLFGYDPPAARARRRGLGLIFGRSTGLPWWVGGGGGWVARATGVGSLAIAVFARSTVGSVFSVRL